MIGNTAALPVNSVSLSGQLALRFGCKRLRWAQQQRRGIQVPHHSVIPLASIVRRQCIIPDCSTRNRRISQGGAAASREAQSRPYFYTNPFLWVRIWDFVHGCIPYRRPWRGTARLACAMALTVWLGNWASFL